MPVVPTTQKAEIWAHKFQHKQTPSQNKQPAPISDDQKELA